MDSPVDGSPVQSGPAALTRRMVGFMAHLRANRIEVGPADTLAALKVVASGVHTPTKPRGEFVRLGEIRTTLKVLLTGRKSEWDRFDDLFEAYWQSRGRIRHRLPEQTDDGAISRATARLWSRPAPGQRALDPSGAAETENPESTPSQHSTPTASWQPQLRRVDLRHVADPQAMNQAQQIAYRLARAIRYRLSRRYRPTSAGSQVDLRRTIRRSLSRGGIPFPLVCRARRDRPVRMVVMLDTSGSMTPYTPYLLQFVRGLAGAWWNTDVYLFHTRLIRVTEVLRTTDAMLAMTRLALMAQGIGGGTRLSESLATFNAHYAKRALNSRSVFVMLSDGYDTGVPDQCAVELARLKRRVRRLIWLNPMLGWERYEPVTRTMRRALPFIDHFAPAHSLDALAALEDELSRV